MKIEQEKMSFEHMVSMKADLKARRTVLGWYGIIDLTNESFGDEERKGYWTLNEAKNARNEQEHPEHYGLVCISAAILEEN